METRSIIDITSLKDQIAENVELYRQRLRNQGADMNVAQYGNEQEYSLNGLIGGVKNILTDISYLVKAHNVFLQLSTYTDRNNIRVNLNNLNNYIQNSSSANIASTLDILKTSLRGYNLRIDKGRFVEFSEEVDRLRKIAMSLEGDIQQIQANITLSHSQHETIQELQTQSNTQLKSLESSKEEFLQTLNSFTEQYQDFQALAQKATTNEITIKEKLESILEDEEIFTEFCNKIDDREKQLTEQKKQTADYAKGLTDFSQEHETLLKKAQTLIDNARIALQYSTAEGISAAFQAQYNEANRPENKKYWLWSALIFIGLTLGLGVWIIAWGPKEQSPVYSLVSRISLMPFTLLGALFCANQYVKQKNLIEDYAYKAVLSKSIVAFSEELREKDNDRYAEYISTVLREIHQDPLRKRGKDKDEINIKDTTGLVDKIVELIKACTK